jgi:hypothetical protein
VWGAGSEEKIQSPNPPKSFFFPLYLSAFSPSPPETVLAERGKRKIKNKEKDPG